MRLFSPPQLQLCCRLQQQLQGCAGGLLSALQSSSLLQKLGVPEGHSSSNSGCSAGSTIWQSQGPLRHMAGRTHKLSLKKANNKASWLAVQQYFKKKLPMPQEKAATQPQQHGPVIETALPPLPSLPEPPLYQKIGRITGPYAVAPQDCFAVVESGGSQFKVTADDVIYHNKIPEARVNDVLEFGKVLLLGGLTDTTIGRPFVPGASVVAAVEENFKDSKVHVFKKKKRKRYSKLFGHRSQITALRILEVRQPSQQQMEAAAAALEASAAAAASAAVQPPAAALQAAEAAGSSGSSGGPAGTEAAAVGDTGAGQGQQKQQGKQKHGEQKRQQRQHLVLPVVGGGCSVDVSNVRSIAPGSSRSRSTPSS